MLSEFKVAQGGGGESAVQKSSQAQVLQISLFLVGG